MTTAEKGSSAHVCTTYVPVTRFAQLKPGCAIRGAMYPQLTGTFKFEGHGFAIVRFDAMYRDAVVSLSDIHMKVEALTC